MLIWEELNEKKGGPCWVGRNTCGFMYAWEHEDKPAQKHVQGRFKHFGRLLGKFSICSHDTILDIKSPQTP